MAHRHRTPWLGMTIAVIAMAVLGFVSGFGLAAVIVALWCGTLWAEWARPDVPEPPAPPPIKPDIEGLVRAAMRGAIESLRDPVMLVDGQRIVAANAAARTTFGAHVTGQDARIALRHPDAIALLDQPEVSSVTVRGLTGAGSLWQLSRAEVDERLWLIELLDRTTELDIGRAHTDFVANASHELRTPLSSIIGYVETLIDTPGATEGQTGKRFLGVVLREARRMQGLVADLMSLSQLEAEKHDPPTDRIDLCALAARVVSEFAPLGTRVQLARGEEPIWVVGDVKQLEQLLRNLIDNALKYGDPEAPVLVNAQRDGRGMAQLSVQDHGPGIAPEHIPHLTRRFYRTDPGRSRAAGGTGLGLAIVKHVVERHRGQLDIASQLGEGTHVTIRLPLSTRRPESERAG